MFYLITQLKHFIYGYKEGNVLFNDTLKTFYLWCKDWLEREIVNGSTPWRIDPTTHHTISEHITTELNLAPVV